AELRLLERSTEALVLARHPLGVDEHREALVERQRDDICTSLLLQPCGGHRAEPHRLEFLHCRFSQHIFSLGSVVVLLSAHLCRSTARGASREAMSSQGSEPPKRISVRGDALAERAARPKHQVICGPRAASISNALLLKPSRDHAMGTTRDKG